MTGRTVTHLSSEHLNSNQGGVVRSTNRRESAFKHYVYKIRRREIVHLNSGV